MLYDIFCLEVGILLVHVVVDDKSGDNLSSKMEIFDSGHVFIMKWFSRQNQAWAIVEGFCSVVQKNRAQTIYAFYAHAKFSKRRLGPKLSAPCTLFDKQY